VRDVIVCSPALKIYSAASGGHLPVVKLLLARPPFGGGATSGLEAMEAADKAGHRRVSAFLRMFLQLLQPVTPAADANDDSAGVVRSKPQDRSGGRVPVDAPMGTVAARLVVGEEKQIQVPKLGPPPMGSTKRFVKQPQNYRTSPELYALCSLSFAFAGNFVHLYLPQKAQREAQGKLCVCPQPHAQSYFQVCLFLTFIWVARPPGLPSHPQDPEATACPAVQ
jgi:hypothetical protein